jgi:hypothetical protein
LHCFIVSSWYKHIQIVLGSSQTSCKVPSTDKKKIKFSSYKRIFRVEQLQSHIWLTASSYMVKYLRISSFIRKPFPIYDFATAPFWISLYKRIIWSSFYQWGVYVCTIFCRFKGLYMYWLLTVNIYFTLIRFINGISEIMPNKYVESILYYLLLGHMMIIFLLLLVN